MATLVFMACCCFFINVFSNMSLIYMKPTSKYRFSDLCYETDRILKYLLLKHIIYFCCHSKHKMGFKLEVVVDSYFDIQNRAILVILAYICTCNCFSWFVIHMELSATLNTESMVKQKLINPRALCDLFTYIYTCRTL